MEEGKWEVLGVEPRGDSVVWRAVHALDLAGCSLVKGKEHTTS